MRPAYILFYFHSSFTKPFWDRGVPWFQLFSWDVLVNTSLQVLGKEIPHFFWSIHTCVVEIRPTGVDNYIITFT